MLPARRIPEGGRVARRAGLLAPLVLALLLGAATRARAAVGADADCTGAPVPDPSLWAVDGPVHAVARVGGTLYVGGSFNSVAPNTGGGVALDVASGLPTRRFPKVDGNVEVIVADGHGGCYLGGSFTHLDGESRVGLAHVGADGRLTAFRADCGIVYDLALKGDTLFAGGYFNAVNGVARASLAALDARTGEALPWTADANQDVRVLEIHGGTLYAGGTFFSIAGQRRTYLASFDLASGALTDWDPNPYNTVHAIAADDSTVYAGGDFTWVHGVARHFFAAIDARTGALRDWAPEPNGSVFTLKLVDHTLYALGWFNTIGGVARNGAAALDTRTGAALPWVSDSTIGRLVAIDVHGPTMLAGWYSATPLADGLAVLDSRTGALAGWNRPAINLVNAVALEGDVAYVGGNFVWFGEALPRHNLAAFDLSTGSALAWNPSPDGDAVTALAECQGTLFVGGDFTNIGGAPGAGLAAFDTRSGRKLAADVSTDGTVEALESDGTRMYVGGTFTRVGGAERHNLAAVGPHGDVLNWRSGADGTVSAIATGRGRVYVGGDFGRLGGNAGTDSTRAFLGALDAATGAVDAWDPRPSGAVSALALSQRSLYVGGGFASLGGLSRTAIGAVDAETGEVLSWDPFPIWLGGPFVPRHGLAVVDSTVMVGGRFTWIGGARHRGFAALDARTARARCWDLQTGYLAYNVMVTREHSLYVGGSFLSAGGWPMAHLAAFAFPGLRPGRPRPGGWSHGPPRHDPAVRLHVPGPVHGDARVRFTLAAAGPVALSVFDVQGRCVLLQRVDAGMEAGEQAMAIPSGEWAPGLYFCRLESGGAVATARLLVVP